jgi:hypothetical protein
MNHMLRAYFKHFIILIFGLTLILYLGWRSYEYLYSDQDLLSEKTALGFAESDVLGNRLYKETCSRISYLDKVEMVSSEEKNEVKIGGYAFKFRPKVGNEKMCPSVTVVVSRHTGEAWVTNIEK